MRESTTYQAILDEGGLQMLHDVLLEQGNEKFGPADEATRLALKAIDDRGRLKRLSVRLVHVSTWAELLATP